MNQILENKYPYLTSFFKTAIEQNRLFHSIILYGSNNFIQYAMALELARQLNCLEDGRSDCNCQNCRWIRENKHPAVMTISKIDNKTDSSKSVISEEQINMVLDTLVNSSDYHRIFIFCDADIKKLKFEEQEKYDEFQTTGYKSPQENVEDKVWYPSGMNIDCFSTVAANAMLKSIEEPASKITFIFLTNNKEDLLQTIVSRSQAFYVPDPKTVVYDTSLVQKFMPQYPNFNIKNSLEFAQSLYAFQIEKDYEPKYVLDCIQYYLLEILKANSNNERIARIIKKDINKVEESKKMIDAYIKEPHVYEDLAFYFARR